MKNILKKTLPDFVLSFLYKLKLGNKTTEDVFTDIYEHNKWGEDPEGAKFFSGPGSVNQNTKKYEYMLVDFIAENNVESIFEIGCGDFRLMNSVLEKSDVHYKGSDVVKSLIDHLSKTHGTEKINFLHINAASDEAFPNADLCIIRQVLQHLSNEQIEKILEKTKKYKYVMITEHLPLHPKCKNGDRVMGGGTRLFNKKTSGVYIDAPPYSLKSKTLLSYREDEESVPALIVTSLVENH